MFDCPLVGKVAKCKKCSCRGLRYCALCLAGERLQRLIQCPKFQEPDTERVAKRRGDVRAEGRAFADHLPMVYNEVDQKAHRCTTTLNCADIIAASVRSFDSLVRSVVANSQQDGNCCFPLPGLRLVPNFITENEEQLLLGRIDGAEWTPSQSGRQKQDYGPRVNFKHHRVNSAKFVGLPDYVDLLLRWAAEREGTASLLDGFRPVELCNLDYTSERLSSIDLHKDDAWIWGDRLVSVSLNSDCVFTLEHPQRKLLVFLPVPRLSLLCLAGPVRSEWNHGIFPAHISGRRVVITLRELAPAFLEDSELFERYGKDIVQRATQRIGTKAK